MSSMKYTKSELAQMRVFGCPACHEGIDPEENSVRMPDGMIYHAPCAAVNGRVCPTPRPTVIVYESTPK